MEWKDASFTSRGPNIPPAVKIYISTFQQAHQQYTKPNSPLIEQINTKAIANSSYQTCISGPKLLAKLKFPIIYIVKTQHAVLEIRYLPLKITGKLSQYIRIRGRSSNKIVYISKNCWEIYLLQTAMREDIPNPNNSGQYQRQQI